MLLRKVNLCKAFESWKVSLEVKEVGRFGAELIAEAEGGAGGGGGGGGGGPSGGPGSGAGCLLFESQGCNLD